MKKPLLITLAFVLAGLFALPATASAQEPSDPNDVTVEGRGWLAARGDGHVDVDMGGRIRLRVEGDVVVVDHAGDIDIRLRGGAEADEEQQRSTNVTLNDYRGAIHVRGTDFSVTVDGKVVLHAHGRGQANLDGQGIYKTRNGERTVWDGMVELGNPQVQAA